MHGPGEPPAYRMPVPSPHRRRRRRRLERLAVTLAVLVTATVLVVVYAVGGPPGPRHAGGSFARRPGKQTVATTVPAPPTTSTTSTTVPPTTTTTTGPGTLPQTTTLPPATSPQLRSEMAALWQGVVSSNTAAAMPAFFPLGAYLQLKAISYAQEDWQDRLVGDFTLDVGAAHALLGTEAASAQLVSVNVPEQYAHWVTPGACYNSIGYYEVPNARVVYQIGGIVKSFGIASMISWRGQWYIVHLGAVLRATTGQGVVDAAATGPGTSDYSGTC